MRPDLDQLAAFSLVVETGSFSKAAQRLSISKSVVSRRVATLEGCLGVRLLSRTTHFVVPTDIGTLFHERARRILQEVDGAVEFVTGAGSEVTGTVRITAPTTFGTMYVTRLIKDLMLAYPRIRIDLDLSDGPSDPFADGADFAIRIGVLRDSSLMAKFFKPVRQVLVCSPRYHEKHGTPETPKDLLKHACLIYTDPGMPPHWQFDVNGDRETIRPAGRLRSNNAAAIRDAAEADLGIAALPMFVANDALERAALIPVIPGHPLQDLGLYALFPSNQNLPAKSRLVLDFMAARWKAPLPGAVRGDPARGREPLKRFAK